MNNPHDLPEGQRFAQIFSAGSRALKYIPPLNWLVVGNNNVPAGWRHRTLPAAAVPAWVQFEGDSKGTRLPMPRLYRHAGIIAVAAAEMDDLRGKNGEAQHAVALKFGQAMVVGALGKGLRFDNVEEPQHELVAVRIARSDVTAAAGLWIPGSETFVPAESAQYYRRVAVADVPLTTPIV